MLHVRRGYVRFKTRFISPFPCTVERESDHLLPGPVVALATLFIETWRCTSATICFIASIASASVELRGDNVRMGSHKFTHTRTKRRLSAFRRLRNQKKLSCIWIFYDGPGRKTGDIDIFSLVRCIRTGDHAFPARDRNSIGQTRFYFFHIRG